MANIVSNLGVASPSQGQQQITPEQGAPPAPIVPFGKSAKRIIAQGATVTQSPWSATVVAQQPIAIPVIGWLSETKLTVTASGGTGIVATAGVDSPWNVAQNIQLLDPTGVPIINLPGYSLYIARLFGGYRQFRPDASAFGYLNTNAVANTPPGSATGNFKCIYDLFNEFSLHEGLGCLDNRDGASPWSLQVTWNAMTAGAGPNNVYGVVPGGTPALTAQLEAFGRAVVQSSTDKYGNPQEQTPPAQGTLKYLTSKVYPVTAGLNTIQLTRVGNFIRAHHLIFRDPANGSRAVADSGGTTPTTLTFQWDNQNRFVVNVQTLRQWAYEIFGFDVPAGVVTLPYTLDPDGIPVSEGGFEYMPTIASTLINLVFTSTAAGTLEVITDDIVPGPGVQL